MYCVSISLVSKIVSTLGFLIEGTSFRELRCECWEAKGAKWEIRGNKEQWEAATTLETEWKVRRPFILELELRLLRSEHSLVSAGAKRNGATEPKLRLLRRGGCSAAVDTSEGWNEGSSSSAEIHWRLNQEWRSFLAWLATKTESSSSSSPFTFQSSLLT